MAPWDVATAAGRTLPAVVLAVVIGHADVGEAAGNLAEAHHRRQLMHHALVHRRRDGKGVVVMPLLQRRGGVAAVLQGQGQGQTLSMPRPLLQLHSMILTDERCSCLCTKHILTSLKAPTPSIWPASNRCCSSAGSGSGQYTLESVGRRQAKHGEIESGLRRTCALPAATHCPGR